ncbi:MAG TPA: hypothetical protein VM618_11895, partial [Acidimicrobiia bacterium]|nr:hypothetical protein [Acidimicrobiia bacterium]
MATTRRLGRVAAVAAVAVALVAGLTDATLAGAQLDTGSTVTVPPVPSDPVDVPGTDDVEGELDRLLGDPDSTLEDLTGDDGEDEGEGEEPVEPTTTTSTTTTVPAQREQPE